MLKIMDAKVLGTRKHISKSPFAKNAMRLRDMNSIRYPYDSGSYTSSGFGRIRDKSKQHDLCCIKRDSAHDHGARLVSVTRLKSCAFRDAKEL